MKVEVENLSKSYMKAECEIKVLNELNFNLNKGEAASLTGPSGVGKSTLLHLLGTLDEPSSGQIYFDGQKVLGMSHSKIGKFRNETIGFVFQFHHLLSEFSALENVAMPLLIRRIDQKSAFKKAKELLSFVSLGHRIDHKPGELSGGEQQRVALARALVQEPKLLLADEPTGNLDEKIGEEIIELIMQYSQQSQASVLLATHNMRISQMFQRRLVLTNEGMDEA